ncbi:hypothetical protein [Undibacterium squillarum]|uniref:Uncharacterized protein n=1 Tax=Undibacterium squillarum TaxID=1131567 RepID=A0ABQ2XX86_9BURK|nr:hypothetical protein [Undibacterium squillarum]GGX38622.1 hypothetical protein GCM10010946_16130 [Undibacterium squillarum]
METRMDTGGYFEDFGKITEKPVFRPPASTGAKHNGKGNKKPPVPAQQVVLAENSSDYFANCA